MGWSLGIFTCQDFYVLLSLWTPDLNSDGKFHGNWNGVYKYPGNLSKNTYQWNCLQIENHEQEWKPKLTRSMQNIGNCFILFKHSVQNIKNNISGNIHYAFNKKEREQKHHIMSCNWILYFCPTLYTHATKYNGSVKPV